MSYTIHHIAGVPKVDGVECYVFVLENPNSAVHKLQDDEFARLGTLLGEHGAAVRGYDETFCTETLHAYYAEARRQGADWEDYPALLITDVHPDDIIPAQTLRPEGRLYCLLPLSDLDERKRDAVMLALGDAMTEGIAVGALPRYIKDRVHGGILRRLRKGTVGISLPMVFSFTLPSMDELAPR